MCEQFEQHLLALQVLIWNVSLGLLHAQQAVAHLPYHAPLRPVMHVKHPVATRDHGLGEIVVLAVRVDGAALVEQILDGLVTGARTNGRNQSKPRTGIVLLDMLTALSWVWCLV